MEEAQKVLQTRTAAFRSLSFAPCSYRRVPYLHPIHYSSKPPSPLTHIATMFDADGENKCSLSGKKLEDYYGSILLFRERESVNLRAPSAGPTATAA
jgi:hypothetical protein